MIFFDFEVFKYDWLVVGIDPITQEEFVIVNNKDNFVVKDKNGKPIRMKPTKELLERGYTIEQILHFEKCWKMQRWVNNRFIFAKCKTFEEYIRGR